LKTLRKIAPPQAKLRFEPRVGRCPLILLADWPFITPFEPVLQQSINPDRNWVYGREFFDCATARSFHSSKGARSGGVVMREEFASYSFLAVTVAGLVLLCSGLVALAIT
jgi:hypothetical protein